ncbi:MAG: tetratricopeptide repeat protein [Planctomycetota bacterium]|nr:tetratricopeptide repeat protein [Planctomycetota bacterium]
MKGAGAQGAVPMEGERVAITGRLATMSRAAAEDAVRRAGGVFARAMSAKVTILVVGMQGWPLMESGHVTRALSQAEQLRAAGSGVRVLSEWAFRELLGLEPRRESDRALALDAKQVCAALGIDERTLQRWEHCGLVRSRGGRFDFQDLVSLRNVTDLVAKGVSPQVIRKSLDALAALLPGVDRPGVDRPLAQLNILVSDRGTLVAELEEALLTPSGQLEMRFDLPPLARDEPNLDGAGRHAGGDPKADAAPLRLVPGEERDLTGWIDLGLEQEASGEWSEAEHSYRRAASLAPSDAGVQFNLGNALLAQGKLEAAAERFAQATALDPTHARAWFNLAHVQDELGNEIGAIRLLKRAIGADPTFADAHFNLADLAERQGDRAAALRAWDEYLRLDRASEWNSEARRRRDALRAPARTGTDHTPAGLPTGLPTGLPAPTTVVRRRSNDRTPRSATVPAPMLQPSPPTSPTKSRGGSWR